MFPSNGDPKVSVWFRIARNLYRGSECSDTFIVARVVREKSLDFFLTDVRSLARISFRENLAYF